MPTLAYPVYDNKLVEIYDKWIALDAAVKARVFFVSSQQGRVWDVIRHAMDTVEQMNPENYKAFHLSFNSLVEYKQLGNSVENPVITPIRYALEWMEQFDAAMDWVKKGGKALIRSPLDVHFIQEIAAEGGASLRYKNDFSATFVNDTDIIAQTFMFKFENCTLSNWDDWGMDIKGDTPSKKIGKLILFGSYINYDGWMTGAYSSCLNQKTSNVGNPYQGFGIVLKEFEANLPA